MAKTGLLILTNPSRVEKLFPIIERHVLKTLYIQYFPEKFLIPGKHTISSSQWKIPRHFDMITNIYTMATTLLSQTDVRVLLLNSQKFEIDTKRIIELVIFDRTCSKDEARAFIKNYLAPMSKSCNYIAIENEAEKHEEIGDNDVKLYNNVVLGGTFDRLHNGHKILLSKAIFHSSNKVVVGVTDNTMISNKLLWELIEPCEQRINNVKEFLNDVNNHIVYDVIPIHDMYGPTINDSTFEMIVVSEETQKGATKINQLRSQNKMNILDVEVVKLINDPSHKANEEFKISSSNQRIRLLGTRIKKPNITGIRLKPYIIGLTGGIASGKSSVAEKLSSLGASIVHCDQLAHELYEPGHRCFNRVVEIFGKEILNSEGKINRRVLGNIVFNDSVMLEKLNKAVWPEVLHAALKQINEFQNQGVEIIVMEAAVLIQAKWQYVCHEIWTCIIPHDEAIKRLMERNNLTMTEAEKRIQVQPSNVEQVQEATVVFSTLWSHEVTLGQVQKAWDLLNEFLTIQK